MIRQEDCAGGLGVGGDIGNGRQQSVKLPHNLRRARATSLRRRYGRGYYREL
jgi:hypothetical protein